MLEGNLHTRILQTKLTPNLAVLTLIMKEEVDQEVLRIQAEYTGTHHSLQSCLAID